MPNDAIAVFLTRDAHALLKLVRSGKIDELFSFHVFSSHHVPDLRILYLYPLYLDVTISNSSFDVAFARPLAALVDAVLFLRERCDALQNDVDQFHVVRSRQERGKGFCLVNMLFITPSSPAANCEDKYVL